MRVYCVLCKKTPTQPDHVGLHRCKVQGAAEEGILDKHGT